jgi:hypothetical protein
MKFKSLSRLLPLVVGSAAAGVLASMSPAHALTYNWSFDGLANTSGTFDTDTANTTITRWDGQVDGRAIQGLLTAGAWENNDNKYPLTNTGVSFEEVEGTSWNLFKAPSTSVLSCCTSTFTGTFTGTFTATAVAVPFDNIPGGATIPAVGSLLALGAMRKVKKSIASKTRIANPVVAVR